MARPKKQSGLITTVEADCPKCREHLVIDLPQGKPEKKEESNMTGEATATFCPHCHEKDLQLQELKHKHDLEALEGKLKMPNFCAEHPDLCPNRAPLSEAKKTIETITKERDAALTKATEIETTHLHPELTEEFLTQQETCPNCGPHIKSYTKKKVDAALTEAKTKAEAEAKVKAEAETKARAEAEAKAKAEVPAKRGYER